LENTILITIVLYELWPLMAGPASADNTIRATLKKTKLTD